MAMQLSRLQPPSLTPAEEARYRTWLETHPAESGFPDGARAINQPALVRDGRQEFSHFWVYPLLTVPVLVVIDTVGGHLLLAFAVTNAALFGAALWVAARVFGPAPALLLLGSPLVWFVGRAQVEVFTVAMLTLAMAAGARGRWGWASLAVAVAATQNAPIAAAIPILWIAALTDWALARRSLGLSLRPDSASIRRTITFAMTSLVIALLHPLYYVIRLGVLTPQELNGGIAGEAPSLARYLAPVTDPDIGLLWWLPVTAALSLLGLAVIARSRWRKCSTDRRTILLAVSATAMALWFLFVFAQTTNVNSGGTVHVSRYALWLLPLALPTVAVATHVIDDRAPGVTLVAGMMLFGAYLGYFWPDQPERYVEHSPQSAWVLSNVTDIYRPLPEVFVERTLGIDGGIHASAADSGCRLILLVAASPDVSCRLPNPQLRAAQDRFAAGDTAVWIRRDAVGAGTVTTALTGP
jgi:hypothetical protein